jgi:hypothetical protein
MQVVFPRLLSYVADLPEQADLTCIKGGNTEFPCDCCWCDHDHLGRLMTYRLRTEADQSRLLTLAEESSNFSSLADLSIHPVASGVWGFRDGDTEKGSSTLSFGFDSLHVDDLGVFPDIIKGVKLYLQKFLSPQRVNQLIAQFNASWPEMPRSDDFSLPGHTSQFFPDCPMFQGKEYRNVMQVCAPECRRGVLVGVALIVLTD